MRKGKEPTTVMCEAEKKTKYLIGIQLDFIKIHRKGEQ